MDNTTYSYIDLYQWMIDHYSDDPDRLNYDPTPDMWATAQQALTSRRVKGQSPLPGTGAEPL